MLRRKDRNLVIEGPVEMGKSPLGGATWRGLIFHAGSAVLIPDIRRFVTFRAFADSCGWMSETPDGTALRVSIVDHDSGEVLGTHDHESGRPQSKIPWSRTGKAPPQPVTLPWPRKVPGKVDLRIERADQLDMPVFLGVHRALSRQWLYDEAVGVGIEIGPGAQPQILPAKGRTVSYVEQMPPEEWNRLYNGGGKYPVRPELWANYVVGDASNLPAQNGSLDFVFGGHIFEHLANPVGHLKRWKQKLATGGKILCVVPDLAGTKDAVQERSTLAEWLEEFAADVWHPMLQHYCRHFRAAPESKQVKAAMARRESIHVHYYDNINCRDLLEYAVRELGYADYVIEHTPNHKDFHFILQNS